MAKKKRTATATKTEIIRQADARPIIVKTGESRMTKAKRGASVAVATAKRAAQAQENTLIGAASGAALAFAEAKLNVPKSGIVDLALAVGLLIAGDAMKSPRMKAAAAGVAGIGGYKLAQSYAQPSTAGDLLGDIDGDDYVSGDLFG